MKIMATALVIALSLVMGMFLMPVQNVTADGEIGAPTDRGDGVLQTAGDWIITELPIGPPIEYRNATIIVNGNLTIENGATLILRNVTLMMNSTNYDGECNIEVLNGGTLNILDGCTITDSPYDVDDGSASDYEFMFWVRDGATFTMKDSELHECGWEWSDNTVGLTIETDGTLIENSTFSNNYCGIYLLSSSGNIIDKNIITSHLWDGIFLESSSNNTISNNTISNNALGGIKLFSSSNDNIIFNNTIYNHTDVSNGEGIEVGSSCYNTTIYNNKISNNTRGIYGGRNNTIYNNKIWNNSGSGISLGAGDYNRVYNNNISMNWFGFWLPYWCYNTIYGNNISNNVYGIYIYGSSNNTIFNNDISSNDYCGIYLGNADFGNSSNNTITDNTISENGFFLSIGGIYLDDYSNGNIITGNSILSNNDRGIGMYGASYNIISGNNISNNLGLGIYPSSDSNHNFISDNNIESNDMTGVYLTDSSNNTISGNIINNHWLSGISIGLSSNYTIVSNNTISNHWGAISLSSSSNAILSGNTITLNNNHGIYLTSSSTNNLIINCSISLSTNYDFLIEQDSHATTINTTFDKSKVHFLDQNSTLTVKWYMHVRVESTNGLPISEANIEVTNTAGDPAQGSPFTTGDDGFVRWIIVTEYIQNDTNKVYSTPHNVTATLSGSTGYAEPYMDLSKVVTITLDTERPIADAGVDASINEDEPHTFDGSGSTDDIGIVNWTWDFGDGTFGYGERPKHTYTISNFYVVVLNVSDATGKWDSDSVSIFVNNVPPIADFGSDKVAGELEQLTFDGSNSIDTFSDIDSLFYTWYFGDGAVGCGKVANHSYEDNGTYIVTLQVTDDDGAISVDSITVTINNTAPKISPVAPQFLKEGEPYTMQIKATDAKGDSLTFSDNSTMFDIDPITGVISFIPINADVGIHLINISVVDDDGGVSYIEIRVMVQNTNDAPIITSSPITVAVENSTYSYNLSVRDDDMDTIIYTLDLKPEGMSIDSEGGISWTPTNQQASQTFMVIVNVSDSKDFDTQTFSVTVMNVNDSPTITSTPILSATEDVPYSYNLDAVDLDIGDRLLYSLDTAPKGMDIDSSTGLLSWIPTNTQVGDNVAVVNVTDSAGAFITQEFTITVSNSNDAPVLEPIGTLEATEEQPFYYQVVGYDVDLNDVLSFYDDSELFDIEENTGIIFFTPSNDDVGTYTLTISVIDSSGAEDSETITFMVLNVNDPPILDPISNQQLIEGTPFNLTITASDPDIGDSIVFIDNTTLFDINPLTGEISFTPTNQDVGEHYVTITAMDREGETDHVTATITIQGAESETSPDYIWWILLIIVIMLEAFIIVYLMKKRTEVNMVFEPKEEEEEPKEIEMELEEPPPPPPPEETVEFETAEESTDNEEVD